MSSGNFRLSGPHFLIHIVINLRALQFAGPSAQGVLDLGQHGNGKSDHSEGSRSKGKTRGMVGRGAWSNCRSFLRPWGEVVKCLGVFGYLGEGAQVSGRVWVFWRGCCSVWALLGILARVRKCLGVFKSWRACLGLLASVLKCLGIW